MNDAGLMRAFTAAGQGHVFRWWDELSPDGRAKLTALLRQVDLSQVARLADDVRQGRLKEAPVGDVTRPDCIALPANAAGERERDLNRRAGESLLREGKVAALTVAGGQGTRLKYDGPKGTYPIGPVSGKTLFQIHAERIRAVARRYGRPLPWYIMTSDTTDAPTRAYFEREKYLGLPPGDVFLFRQSMMPALDRSFKLVLTARDEILLSPNGHGGTLPALLDSGALADMERRGIEQISYFQVDNPVVPAADPVFIGAHVRAGAQMSSKAVWKREPEAPIGAFVRSGGRLTVREYSDLTPQEMRLTTPDGRLLYGLGSIAIHVLRVDFVREELAGGFRLPWHLAEKNSAVLDDSGRLVTPKEKNIYKFETFIFDALRDARASVILEIRREAEFLPVKNATGKDSAESCRAGMSRLYTDWLAFAGISVPRDASGQPLNPVEISPLAALDPEELAASDCSRLPLDRPLYLAPDED